MSVIVAHTSPIFGSNYVGGSIAVKAFYIISGFYMSLVLNEKYLNKTGSYKLFITNRFLRIYPVYWVVLLLTVICSLIFFHVHPEDKGNLVNLYLTHIQDGTIKWWAVAFLIVVNVSIIGQDAVMFMGLGATGSFFFTPNFWQTEPRLYSFLAVSQAWTISLELMFYIIAPFLVRRSVKVIFPIIILSFLTRMYFYRQGFSNDPWSYRFFPFEIGFFLIGNVCYRVYQKIKLVNINFEKLYFPFVISILLVTYFYNHVPLNILIKEYLYYSFICAMVPLLLLASKNKKWDTYIGELSYLLYISHIFILLLINQLHIPYFNQLGIATLILSVAFSILSNELLAKKIEKYRQRRVFTSLSSRLPAKNYKLT